MRMLVTNDDSHDSPLFLMLIEALQELGDLQIVVPASEQSWKGKSMTRYGALYVDQIQLHGHVGHSVTGTPADCVNIGMYNLMPEPPDLVVSGINIGTNTGLGFLLASGTVGACLEGNIGGVPGLALSQELTPEVYHLWSSERRFDSAVLTALRADLAQTLPLIWQQYAIAQDASAANACTWSINLPKTLAKAEVIQTRLGATGYRSCFEKSGDQYHHRLRDVTVDQAQDTDAMITQSGRVSATRIDLSALGQTLN